MHIHICVVCVCVQIECVLRRRRSVQFGRSFRRQEQKFIENTQFDQNLVRFCFEYSVLLYKQHFVISQHQHQHQNCCANKIATKRNYNTHWINHNGWMDLIDFCVHLRLQTKKKNIHDICRIKTPTTAIANMVNTLLSSLLFCMYCFFFVTHKTRFSIVCVNECVFTMEFRMVPKYFVCICISLFCRNKTTKCKKRPHKINCYLFIQQRF